MTSQNNLLAPMLGAIVALIALAGSTLAAPITVQNFSFETFPDAASAQQGFTDNNIPGWSFVGTVTGGFQYGIAQGAEGRPAVFTQATPNGTHVSYQNPDGYLSQTLAATLTGSTNYSLSAFFGNPANRADPTVAPRLELYAGGTLLASSAFALPPNGFYSQITATYVATASDPLIGSALEIRLVKTGGGQGSFDNVTLDATSAVTVPEPSTPLLAAFGAFVVFGLRRRKRPA